MITVITILNYTMISGLVKRGRSQNFGLTGAEKLRKINKNRKAADWNGSKREYGRSKYARGADPRGAGGSDRIRAGMSHPAAARRGRNGKKARCPEKEHKQKSSPIQKESRKTRQKIIVIPPLSIFLRTM